MPQRTGTLLIPRDIGAAWGSRQVTGLVHELELRLNDPVAVWSPLNSEDSLATGIQGLVDAGVDRLVVLPLGLLPVLGRGSVQRALRWAKRQWSFLAFHVAAPLSWLEWSGWLCQTVLDSIQELRVEPAEIVVLVVGRHCADPLANADVARLAYLMQETAAMPCVRYAFLNGVRHGFTEVIASVVREGFHNVIVVPWLICDSELSQCLDAKVAHAARLHNVCVTLAAPSLSHAALINLLVSNQYAALSINEFQVPVGTNDELKASGDDTPSIGSLRVEITPEEEFELQEMERRINALLPSEYQGRYESVSPQSMGTAALKFDSEGRVAWDQIWTSFCDLALAGGPPHRGTLLEAVTAADALAEPEKYQAVVAEIELRHPIGHLPTGSH